MRRFFIFGGQGVIVSHKKEALIFVLKLHPVFKHTVQVAKV
jgi:hypothetical protein